MIDEKIISNVVYHADSSRLNVTLSWRHDMTSTIKGIVFTYGSLYEKSLLSLQYGFGGGYLLGQGYLVCSILDSKKNWYQGINLSFIAELESSLCELGFSGLKRFSYGSSMGAFAALLFAPLLKVDLVLAISPQYSIWESWDKTWEQYAKTVSDPFLPSRDHYSESCTSVVIVVDQMHKDYLHALKFEEIIDPKYLSIVKIKFSGHPSSSFLGEIGKLKELLVSAFSSSLENFSISKNLYHQSPTYRFNLAVQLRKRKKRNMALKVLCSALDLVGGDGIRFEIFRLICILEKERGSANVVNVVEAAIAELPRQRDVFIKFLV